MRPVTFAGMLIVLSMAMWGCEKAGQPVQTGMGAAPASGYRFTFVIYGTSGNPFWTKVIAGAEEAAKTLNCSVDVQFANNDTAKQNDILETAIANKVDGIGMAINFDDAYDAVVKKALDQNIAVVAYNIDDTQRAAGNARMAYIGQDMETAGYLIAKRLVQDGNLKAGDFVVCPVEHPEAVYAVQRYAGVKRALDEAGVLSEVLNTGGVSLEDTLNKLTQYLLGHKNTAAICAMGGMPMEMAPQATAEAGLTIPNAGFDLTERIAQNIVDGRSLATVDQQPFYQGYLTILQLFYNRKYGLHPCDINTGGAMVDSTNAPVVKPLANSVR